MIVEYYKSQILSSEMECFSNCIFELELKYYASNVLARIGITEQTDLERAINRAVALCRLTNVPVTKHFKIIYKENNKSIIKDWKLSQLACRIILISEYKP